VTAERNHEVYTLLVEVGRKAGDGLPDDCDGAALVVFTAAADEETAVRDTVEMLRQADLAPLSVDSYGTEAERRAAGQDIDPDHEVLMVRAREENAVIIAEFVPFTDEDDEGDCDGGGQDDDGAQTPEEGAR